MGKKKRKKKQNNEIKQERPPTKSKTGMFAGLAAAVLVLGAGYYIFQTKFNTPVISAQAVSSGPSYADRVEKAGLIETRPLMPPGRYNAKVGQVYRWAAEIPEVFDKLYCTSSD